MFQMNQLIAYFIICEDYDFITPRLIVTIHFYKKSTIFSVRTQDISTLLSSLELTVTF